MAGDSWERADRIGFSQMNPRRVADVRPTVVKKHPGAGRRISTRQRLEGKASERYEGVCRAIDAGGLADVWRNARWLLFYARLPDTGTGWGAHLWS